MIYMPADMESILESLLVALVLSGVMWQEAIAISVNNVYEDTEGMN